MRPLFLALGLGLPLGVAGPAQASLFCELKPTKDGFVALRERPRAKARMLQRMRPGDEIMIGEGKEGAWVEVVYWRGSRFAYAKSPEGHPPTDRGWMHSRLIAEDSCG